MELSEYEPLSLQESGPTESQISQNDVSVRIESDQNQSNNAPSGALHMTNGDPIEGEPTEQNQKRFSYDPETGDIIFQKKVLKKDTNSCALAVSRFQTTLSYLYGKNKRTVGKVCGVILLLAYIVYLIYSLVDGGVDSEGQVRLLVLTIIVLLLLFSHFAQNQLEPMYQAVDNFKTSPNYFKKRLWIKWALYIACTIITVTLIIVLVAIEVPRNLLSLIGLAALVLICYVTSYSPAMIDWHPVFWGFSVQFYFAVIILKTRWGFDAFTWLGDRVTELLQHSNAGAKFVFGDDGYFSLKNGTTLNIKNATTTNGMTMDLSSLQLADGSTVVFTNVNTIHFFAFQVLPVVIFFSSFVAILNYLGVMQFIIVKIGFFLSFCLGTTPGESLNAAGNIFFAMTVSPLMIRPLIGKMTSSELHAVMTAGFATIAGAVLAIYIGFGIPANHLLSASVMSAPAALAISKITYPEIEVPIIADQDYVMEKSTDKNVLQAACNGAFMSSKICAAIIVNVIAFLSLLHLLNATLTWFGDRVGVDRLTFEMAYDTRMGSLTYTKYTLPVSLCLVYGSGLGGLQESCRVDWN